MANNSRKSRGVGIREKMEALDSAMQTAEREEAARRRQAKIYEAARKDIQKTLDDARKVLGDKEFNRTMAQERMSPAELRRWSMQMERAHKALEKRCKDAGIEYLEQDTEEAARRAKENAARRSITRAQAMLASIDAATAKMAADTQINVSKTLKSEAIKSSRNEEKKLEIGFEIELDSISPEKVKALANEDFHGGNYTNKIRRGREKLKMELERCVRLGQVNGWSISRLSKEMSKRVGISERESNRLIRTEMTRVSNEAALDQLKSCGAKFYKYIATMDSRTCERCKALHGQVFPVDKAKSGVNFPPMHPNCRCRIVISAGNETGEYDTSYVDDIVDANIQKALEKWASEGIEVELDGLLSSENGNNPRPQPEFPAEAYQSKEESNFQAILDQYEAEGVSYDVFTSNYIQSMRSRGIPSEVISVIQNVYTKRVWEELPPVYVCFDRAVDVSQYSNDSNSINLSCNDSLRLQGTIAHEISHAIDYKLMRPNGTKDNTHYINIAFRRDASKLISEGITINDRHYSSEVIRSIAGKYRQYQSDLIQYGHGIQRVRPQLPQELIQFCYDLSIMLGIPIVETERIITATNLVFDSLQSVLGYEYGAGHDAFYCQVFSGSYAEAIANSGEAYLLGYEPIFQKLFENGYRLVKGYFSSKGIRPMRLQ